MKKLITICFLVAMMILFSCKTMFFKVPQPLDTINLKEFPDSIRGFYTSENIDTLKIDQFSFVMGNKDSSVEGCGNLNSDSITLKQLREYLVLSIKEGDYWDVLLIKYNKDTLTTFNIDINDEENDNLNKISKITPFRTLKNDKGEIVNYLINPSKKQFEELVDLNLFTKSHRFIKKSS
jgi:hypothetical protein